MKEDKDENNRLVLFETETMSEEQRGEFQSQLWILLAQRTERYTMGDSSSVPVEVAEELWKSICYCITVCQKAGKRSSASAPINVKRLFLLGLTEVERQVSIGKKRLKEVAARMLPINNIFYQDLLPEAVFFFKKYNYHFFAHEIPCMIDYPLCHAKLEEQGIHYINRYLSCFSIENNFCHFFHRETILTLLESYSSDYKRQMINIYEIVANNALALTLLHKDVFSLDVCETDGLHVAKHLLSLSKEKALAELTEAAKTLCHQLEIVGADAIEYLRQTAVSLFRKIEGMQKSGNFSKLFCSLCSK